MVVFKISSQLSVTSVQLKYKSSTPRLRRSPYTKEIPMFHTIIIVGNLGKDPEMRYTPSGQAVTSFSVASNRSWTDSNGQKQTEVIWFRISAWGKQAEICNQYLKKGSKVLIE